jgi:copper chaperone CopZ
MTIVRLCLLCALLAPFSGYAGEPRTATFRVDGMACMLCEAKVKKALQKTPGVLEAKADRATKRAEAKYDPAQVSPDTLAAVIANMGFKAVLKQ